MNMWQVIQQGASARRSLPCPFCGAILHWPPRSRAASSWAAKARIVLPIRKFLPMASPRLGTFGTSTRDFLAINGGCGYSSPDAGLAQLVEHLICNQGVTGSSPVPGTIHLRGNAAQMNDKRAARQRLEARASGYRCQPVHRQPARQRLKRAAAGRKPQQAITGELTDRTAGYPNDKRPALCAKPSSSSP